jgi:hypothetical protein
MFSAAFLLLVSSAIINERSHELDILSSQCVVLKSGVFAGAALTATALGVAYNLLVTFIRKQTSSSGTNSSLGEDASFFEKRYFAIGKPIYSSEEHANMATHA